MTTTREYVLHGKDVTGREIEICVLRILSETFTCPWGKGYLIEHDQSGAQFAILAALGRQWVTLHMDDEGVVMADAEPIDVGAPSPEDAMEALADRIVEAELYHLRQIAIFN